MEPSDRGTSQGCPLQQDLHTWEGAPETLLGCPPCRLALQAHPELPPAQAAFPKAQILDFMLYFLVISSRWTLAPDSRVSLHT